MNFKINLKEFEFFKTQLKKDQNLSRAIPDITSSILKFNNSLETSVEKKFNVPEGMSLNDVWVGKTVNNQNIGNTLLRFSLQYRHVNIPLYKFPFQLHHLSGVESTAPLRKNGDPLGFVKWTVGEWSWEVETFVLKGIPFINHTVQPIFYNKWNGKGLLRFRAGDATWSTLPTKNVKGLRAPTLPGWGMSLSQMVKYSLATDDNLRQMRYNMGTEIINSLVKSL